MSNCYPISGCASWLEINESALKHNIKELRKVSGDTCKLGVVLKGGAYGHGTDEVFQVVQPLVDCIYVITAQDAFRMRQIEREKQLTPIRLLVIGALSIDEMILCAENSVEVVIGAPISESDLNQLKGLKSRLACHIHLDTGLSREGFSPESLSQDLDFLKLNTSVFEVKGVMSHFANTEDVTEQDYAKLQLENFQLGYNKIKGIFVDSHFLERHIAASAATLVIPTARFDIVRVGISLYGFWPSTETRLSAKLSLGEIPQFQPVLSWKCKSQLIKPLKKGSYVGYGCTFRAERDLYIAIFPVGYFDGYPRSVSGKAHVLVNEKRCPVVGRVMMNHIIVDVTNVEGIEQVHSVEAVLIGRSGKETISAESVANWAQTIHYELVARLGAHLKRVLVSQSRA